MFLCIYVYTYIDFASYTEIFNFYCLCSVLLFFLNIVSIDYKNPLQRIRSSTSHLPLTIFM